MTCWSVRGRAFPALRLAEFLGFGEAGNDLRLVPGKQSRHCSGQVALAAIPAGAVLGSRDKDLGSAHLISPLSGTWWQVPRVGDDAANYGCAIQPLREKTFERAVVRGGKNCVRLSYLYAFRGLSTELTLRSLINHRKSLCKSLLKSRAIDVDSTKDILDSCRQRTEAAFKGTEGARLAGDAALYLAHTEMGESLRQLARVTGKHPSTVMRTVRKLEQRRDDPLFDSLLAEVEKASEAKVLAPPANENRSPRMTLTEPVMTVDELRKEAKKYLRRLSEPGAFLFIARDAKLGGVFCPANGQSRPIATLPVTTAAEFLKQDWIKAASRGATSVRYRITEVGRSFLRRTLADDQAQKAGPGMAEQASPFADQHKELGERLFADPTSGTAEPKTVNLGESPIGWLARRKGPDGKAFLAPEEVEAGEKLRSDFEAAQMGPQVAQDWRKFLAPSDRYSGNPTGSGHCEGPQVARDRLTRALGALGPGLADVVVRTCCFLEGLEACERRMGWSARSGKVVLKLALQRLAQHYGYRAFS